MTDRRNLPYVVASLLAIGIIAWAWMSREQHQQIGPGAPAPPFEAVTLGGDEVRVEDYLGTVVLLNIWATWCAPCIWEMPSMQRLYDAFAEEDFEIIAVSIDARPGSRDPLGRIGGDVQSFVDRLDLTFPIWLDPEGRIQSSYRSSAVPESFVIGRDGLIYRRVIGATEWDHESYMDFIRRLLDE